MQYGIQHDASAAPAPFYTYPVQQKQGLGGSGSFVNWAIALSPVWVPIFGVGAAASYFVAKKAFHVESTPALVGICAVGGVLTVVLPFVGIDEIIR